jgi:hypothetical protein
MHPTTGDLVHTNQHRFSGLPAGGSMFHEVGTNFLQTVVGDNHLIVFAEQLFQQCFLIRVKFGHGN